VITPKAARQYATSELNTALARIKHAHGELYRRAWLAQTYTPAQYFAELGTDGAEMLAAMEALASVANALKGGSVTLVGTPQPVTIADDGSVTVGG
jgi:hypothetical protein